MRITALVIPAVATALLLPSATAHADFGSRGTVVIESELDLDVSHRSVTSPSGSSSSTNDFDIGLGGRYFVADHVDVGAAIDFLHRSDDSDRSQSILGVNLSAGYQHRLGERLHVWPQAAVAYARGTTSASVDITVSTIAVSAYVPLGYELAEHVMVGWGPTVGTSVYSSMDVNGTSSDDDKLTFFGASAFIAGWF